MVIEVYDNNTGDNNNNNNNNNNVWDRPGVASDRPGTVLP